MGAFYWLLQSLPNLVIGPSRRATCWFMIWLFAATPPLRLSNDFENFSNGVRCIRQHSQMLDGRSGAEFPMRDKLPSDERGADGLHVDYGSPVNVGPG